MVVKLCIVFPFVVDCDCHCGIVVFNTPVDLCRWNDSWQGKAGVLAEYCTCVTLLTKNSNFTVTANPCRFAEKLSSNPQTCGKTWTTFILCSSCTWGMALDKCKFRISGLGSHHGYGVYLHAFLNLLKTKSRLLYLKTQFVPRSKHL